MDYDLFVNTLNQRRKARLLAQHVEKVGERLQLENLSTLELKDLHEKKVAEGYDAPADIKERLNAEIKLLESFIQEQDPEPTHEEKIALKRALGMKDDADDDEHALKKVRKREEIARLRSELEHPNLPGFQRSGIESTLQKAQEELAHMEAHHPVYERQAKAKALREDAREIELQLGDMQREVQRPATQRLQRELSERHEALLAEADRVEAGEIGNDDAA
jgi:hypothetical protein